MYETLTRAVIALLLASSIAMFLQVLVGFNALPVWPWQSGWLMFTYSSVLYWAMLVVVSAPSRTLLMRVLACSGAGAL